MAFYNSYLTQDGAVRVPREAVGGGGGPSPTPGLQDVMNQSSVLSGPNVIVIDDLLDLDFQGSGALGLSGSAGIPGDVLSSAGPGVAPAWVDPNTLISLELNDLTDVDISNPLNDQYFRYNSSTARWENTSVSPGGVGGSGTSGQVAYWDGVSSIKGESTFLYDEINNRLRIGTTAADKGAIGLPVGATGGIFFDTGTLNKPGFFMTYDATLGSIFNFSANSGQTSDASKIHFQLGEIASAASRSWMFSSEGTGKGNLEVEGGLLLHNTNAFLGVSDIGALDTTTVIQTQEGNAIGWWRPGAGTPLRKLKVTTSDEWSIHRNINHSTGGNNVIFTTEPASGSTVEYVFTNPGAGVGSIRTEGYVAASNSNGFSRALPFVGDFRLPTDGTIYGRGGTIPSVELVAMDSATNKLKLRGNDLWPLSTAAGVVSNDGTGVLSFYRGAAISSPAADVASLKTAVDAIRARLTAGNITL